MKQRITYLDAMRGLAMLLVVIGHVILFSFGVKGNSMYYRVFNLYLEVPLFFMISGFFLYKPLEQVSGKSLAKFAESKFILYVITPLFLMWIYIMPREVGFMEGILDAYKQGFWFTIALFEFSIVYLVLALICKWLRLSRYFIPISLVVGLMLSFFGVWAIRVEHEFAFVDIFGLTHFTQFFYFVLGSSIKRYFSIVGEWLNSSVIMGVSILAFFGMMIYSCADSVRYFGPSSTLYFILFTMLGLVIVFSAFMRYPALSEGNAAGRFLNLVGRRTLDVYFLHYFLLPRNLQMVGEWFVQYDNPLLEYITAGVVAVVIILASLGLGAIIRLSPMLGHFLLGAKKE